MGRTDPDKGDDDASRDGDAKAGLPKLGFKFTQSKARPSAVAPAKVVDAASKEFVSALGEKGIETLGGKAAAGAKIIPKLENKWRPESKMRSLQETIRDHDIEQKTEDRFVVEQTIAAGAVEGVQYGLQIRVKTEVKEEVRVAQPGGAEPVAQDPGRSFKSFQEEDAEQLKKDLSELPDEADEDAYDSMPVEDFGKAMLRGMGWVEGKAVGRNAKGKVVEPVVNVPRPDRLGLGAAPKPPEVKDKKYIKPGETRGPKADLVAAPGSDGRPRNSRRVGEDLVEREKQGVHVGKVMEIVAGRHSGLKGEVLSIRKEEGRSDRAVVRLRGSEEVVEVRVQELVDVNKENGQQSNGNGSSNGGARTNGSGQNGSRQNGAGASKRGREGGEPAREPQQRRKVDDCRQGGDGTGGEAPWLVPHIRVRIVSKSLQSGRLYLKKATVVDVVTPTTAELTVDETGQSLQGVHQSSLETALPKRGGNVAVVTGKEKGRRGRLLERDSERGVGVVQFSDHRVEGVEIVRLELDSVAEFVGHDDDLD